MVFLWFSKGCLWVFYGFSKDFFRRFPSVSCLSLCFALSLAEHGPFFFASRPVAFNGKSQNQRG